MLNLEQKSSEFFLGYGTSASAQVVASLLTMVNDVRPLRWEESYWIYQPFCSSRFFFFSSFFFWISFDLFFYSDLVLFVIYIFRSTRISLRHSMISHKTTIRVVGPTASLLLQDGTLLLTLERLRFLGCLSGGSSSHSSWLCYSVHVTYTHRTRGNVTRSGLVRPHRQKVHVSYIQYIQEPFWWTVFRLRIERTCMMPLDMYVYIWRDVLENRSFLPLQSSISLTIRRGVASRWTLHFGTLLLQRQLIFDILQAYPDQRRLQGDRATPFLNHFRVSGLVHMCQFLEAIGVMVNR